MRKTITFFALTALLLSISTVSFAKIWRVNNNNSVTADFTSLSEAHTGAAEGDTLHVEGSPFSYGSVTLTKRLVILGAGYFLEEYPTAQALAQTSKSDNITIYASAAGTVIMGLDFRANGITVHANDIVIRRNRFSSPGNGLHDWSTGTVSLNSHQSNGNLPVNNIIISQNYGLKVDVNYASTGLLITNNFLATNAGSGENNNSLVVGMHANAVGIIQNNILRRGRLSAFNSSITNNIMVNGTFDGTGNLVANNIGNGTQFGTTNGNKSNVDMTAVFVGTGTDITTDGQWKLKVGSPAIGAGYGHTTQNPVDAGMFSGYTPYVLAGLPPIPAIYYFENKPVGSDTDPISVTIKVKSIAN
ncbi:hypothetical protein HRG84_02390 [Flavisolibacter sp. BT320]|nr:hypothetical protein [Flavisolibacter longurius]